MRATGPYADAPFTVDLGIKSVTTVEDGDLVLEGFAATWDEDLSGELFEPGAFSQKTVDSFLAGQASCLAAHDPERPLGKITHAELRPGGLWVKALIPRPAPGSWADREDWYEKLRRNFIRGMSVAGRFWRRPGPDGRPRIYRSTLAEISVSPHPVNPFALGTVSLASAAQKAFATDSPADDLAAIKSTLTDLKNLKEHTTMKWKPKTKAEPRATLLTTDRPLDVRNRALSKTELAQAHARDADRAAEETTRVDGVVTTEHEVSGQDRATIFGVIGAADVGTVERELQPHEVDGLFNVNRTEAVDPRSQGLSYLQAQELEAREAQRRAAEQAKQDEWRKRLDALEEATR